MERGEFEVHFQPEHDLATGTIVGAEANLAARLQAIAAPDSIVMSYEAYALTRDMVTATQLPPIVMKSIGREVVPYAVTGVIDTATGVDFATITLSSYSPTVA